MNTFNISDALENYNLDFSDELHEQEIEILIEFQAQGETDV